MIYMLCFIIYGLLRIAHDVWFMVMRHVVRFIISVYSSDYYCD